MIPMCAEQETATGNTDKLFGLLLNNLLCILQAWFFLFKVFQSLCFMKKRLLYNTHVRRQMQ